MPPDPPRVNNCRSAMFSTSANDIAPPDGKSYVRAWSMYAFSKPADFEFWIPREKVLSLAEQQVGWHHLKDNSERLN